MLITLDEAKNNLRVDTADDDGLIETAARKLCIGERGTRSFKQLNELFTGNGMIGFVEKERVDGKLILPEAGQVMKLKVTG